MPSTTLIESDKLHPNITVRPKRSNQIQPPSLGAQDEDEDDEDEDEDQCVICLDPVRMREAKTSTCKSGCHHVVHSQCWRMYLMKIPAGKRSCPMCRNKDTHWPDDELSRIAFLYADPVEDIIEKGPTWWLGLTQQYVNLHYFQEDETQEEFTSRMEESLQEALDQGATDPEPDSDDEDMPSLISDEDYQMGPDDEISQVTVLEEYTIDEEQVLENDASLAHARETAQRLEEEFYQDQSGLHQEIAEAMISRRLRFTPSLALPLDDMPTPHARVRLPPGAAEERQRAAPVAGFERWGPRRREAVEDALETEFSNSLERELLEEFDLENDDDASIGATHPDDNLLTYDA